MPLCLSLKEPYPATDGICRDAYSLRIISPAYASPQGELNSALQFQYHSFFFERERHGRIAETLKGISVCDMRHLDLLGKTILALGAAPIYAQNPQSAFNFYSAKYVAFSSSLRHMLEDDVRGKRCAIAMYSRMLKSLVNAQVRSLISRILDDEKMHLETLAEILSDFNG